MINKKNQNQNVCSYVPKCVYIHNTPTNVQSEILFILFTVQKFDKVVVVLQRLPQEY